jgi:hypothetical protein
MDGNVASIAGRLVSGRSNNDGATVGSGYIHHRVVHGLKTKQSLISQVCDRAVMAVAGTARSLGALDQCSLGPDGARGSLIRGGARKNEHAEPDDKGEGQDQAKKLDKGEFAQRGNAPFLHGVADP